MGLLGVWGRGRAGKTTISSVSDIVRPPTLSVAVVQSGSSVKNRAVRACFAQATSDLRSKPTSRVFAFAQSRSSVSRQLLRPIVCSLRKAKAFIRCCHLEAGVGVSKVWGDGGVGGPRIEIASHPIAPFFIVAAVCQEVSPLRLFKCDQIKSCSRLSSSLQQAVNEVSPLRLLVLLSEAVYVIMGTQRGPAAGRSERTSCLKHWIVCSVFNGMLKEESVFRSAIVFRKSLLLFASMPTSLFTNMPKGPGHEKPKVSHASEQWLLYVLLL